jgi:predicted AAA+ superfamily ATPase
VVDRDFAELGQEVRNPVALRRWMTAYAAATSTTATFESIRAAATASSGSAPARSTVIPYRDALQRLWIVDPVPGWLPTRNRLRRLVQAEKHHLADPALAAHLLGVDAGALLAGAEVGPRVPRDGTLLGALFESLVTLSLRVYAQAARARVYHLRTKGGEHEVDLIVERPDGRIVAVEVKLARTVEAETLRHLLWLRDTLGDDLLDAAVITTGPEAYRREDGIAVVPASLLGA